MSNYTYGNSGVKVILECPHHAEGNLKQGCVTYNMTFTLWNFVATNNYYQSVSVIVSLCSHYCRQAQMHYTVDSLAESSSISFLGEKRNILDRVITYVSLTVLVYSQANTSAQ